MRCIVSVGMHAAHGAVYLAAKSTGIVQNRTTRNVPIALAVWVLLFALGGV